MIHFLQFFFAPAHQAWYTGNVWGNVVAVMPCAMGGWFVSRARHIERIELQKRHHAELLEHLSGTSTAA